MTIFELIYFLKRYTCPTGQIPVKLGQHSAGCSASTKNKHAACVVIRSGMDERGTGVQGLFIT